MHRRFSVLALVLLVVSGCGLNDFRRGFRQTDTQRIEEFEQLQPSTADILWVIDTSCSMIDEQEALAANFPAFIEFFLTRQLAFNLAVTSTNIGEEDSEGLEGLMVGEPQVITEADEDAAGLFEERALLGLDDRHSDEKGLTAAYEAIEVLGDTANSGFLRADAHLAVIVVSDEPDYSAREGAPEDLVDWESFAEWMNALKGPTGQRMSDLSAIVGFSPEGPEVEGGCGDELGEGQPGSQGLGALRGDGYLEAAQATGGTIGSICSEDWGDMLGVVGLRAAGLLDRFELTEIPLIETLDVRVDGQRVADWEYSEADNAVVFTRLESVPQPGDIVLVEYHVPEEPATEQ